jgi:hypothetical protein
MRLYIPRLRIYGACIGCGAPGYRYRTNKVIRCLSCKWLAGHMAGYY